MNGISDFETKCSFQILISWNALSHKKNYIFLIQDFSYLVHTDCFSDLVRLVSRLQNPMKTAWVQGNESPSHWVELSIVLYVSCWNFFLFLRNCSVQVSPRIASCNIQEQLLLWNFFQGVCKTVSWKVELHPTFAMPLRVLCNCTKWFSYQCYMMQSCHEISSNKFHEKVSLRNSTFTSIHEFGTILHVTSC